MTIIPFADAASAGEVDPGRVQRAALGLEGLVPLPTTPLEASIRNQQMTRRVSRWNKHAALSALAALQLDPQLHVHAVRFYWASRLVAGLAVGDTQPNRADLLRFLNSDLGKADVSRLEDPSEDLFVQTVSTRQGERRLLCGTWAHPAFYTETLLEAAERIAVQTDESLLASVHALLRLSDVIAARAGLDRRVAGSGGQWKDVPVPSTARLMPSLACAKWSRADLAEAGLEISLLDRFVSEDHELPGTMTERPGCAAFDTRPLLRTRTGILLAIPCTVSLAARAAIVDHMLAADREAEIAEALLAVQAERLAESGFVRLDDVSTRLNLGEPTRSIVREESPGRHVHVEQTAGQFSGWREHGFGDLAPANEARRARITASMLSARHACASKPRFITGTTIYLMGSWGPGEIIEFARPKELRGWRFAGIDVADAIALGAAKDGSLQDFWRLEVLEDMVENLGFKLRNLSGPLNLHEWWRQTDFALVPQGGRDLVPPMSVVIPTDSLFAARQRAALAFDRRSALLPDGTWRTVGRLDPHAEFGVLEPIYASYDEVRHGLLLGVVLDGPMPIWLSIRHHPGGEGFNDGFQNWKAALHWIALILDLIHVDGWDVGQPVIIELELQAVDTLNDDPPNDAELDGAISIAADPRSRTAHVHASERWQQGARRVENRAEVALAAAMLEAIQTAAGAGIDRSSALKRVIGKVGSPHVRWRHAYYPDRVADRLRLHHIIAQRFRPIPRTAVSIVKHGHALGLGHLAGEVVQGREECATLLKALHARSLEHLLLCVAHYDRRELVTSALSLLQASLADEQHWAVTARALRAIHGEDADRDVSLEHRNATNANLRACAMLAEVAASHAPSQGGSAVGGMDLDELRAIALQHFGYCELLPALVGDRLPARLVISPTGDLLYDHSFGESTLAPSATAMHLETRERDIERYDERMAIPRASEVTLQSDLIAALEAEFRSGLATFGDLSAALGEIAIAERRDVLILRRSELINRLEASDLGGGAEIAPLIDRLTLRSRDGWNDIPADAFVNDYDLGRFDRPQSIIGRPLVALDNEPDPSIAVAPAVVERSAVHNLAGAYDGGLQDRFWSSSAMRSQVGRASNAAGNAFNATVANALVALGLDAAPEVAPWAALNQKATPEMKLLGDIDVLAFSKDRKHVWVIEAKDIKLCRTLAETTRRLSEYRGVPRHNGKPDNLMRHLNRVTYVRQHVAALARRYRLPTIPRVHGLVVVDSPQPMAFVETHPSSDAVFIRLRDIGNVNWSMALKRRR
ncbi:hypothetical protein [Sphingomonas aurantiaca]|uniref:hypothetical protein n=1 Tax=Sphingomonas aurantiaca TaxID=185949 RepID=UPI003358C4A2